MARVPEGADLIPNRYTGAPGIRHGNVFIMAGVPSITSGMLDALSGQLEGGAPLLSETVGCWVGESEVADLLRETEKAHAACQIGSYPFWRDGRTGANFVIRSVMPTTSPPAPIRWSKGWKRLAGQRFPAGYERAPVRNRAEPPTLLSGCATSRAERVRGKSLAAQDSATAALGEWCRMRGIARTPGHPRRTARRIARSVSRTCAGCWQVAPERTPRLSPRPTRMRRRGAVGGGQLVRSRLGSRPR